MENPTDTDMKQVVRTRNARIRRLRTNLHKDTLLTKSERNYVLDLILTMESRSLEVKPFIPKVIKRQEEQSLEVTSDKDEMAPNKKPTKELPFVRKPGRDYEQSLQIRTCGDESIATDTEEDEVPTFEYRGHVFKLAGEPDPTIIYATDGESEEDAPQEQRPLTVERKLTAIEQRAQLMSRFERIKTAICHRIPVAKKRVRNRYQRKNESFFKTAKTLDRETDAYMQTAVAIETITMEIEVGHYLDYEFKNKTRDYEFPLGTNRPEIRYVLRELKEHLYTK